MFVIPLPYTSTQPVAMMIESFNAIIASSTMRCSRRSYNFTGVTKVYLHKDPMQNCFDRLAS